MFYELHIYCKVIFIISYYILLYTVILILKITLIGSYLLAYLRALKIIETTLMPDIQLLPVIYMMQPYIMLMYQKFSAVRGRHSKSILELFGFKC